LGFFVREGTLNGDNTVALLGPFAAPSHGTFWVSCPAPAGLRSVIAREVTVAEEVTAREVAELLRANVGKRVTIWTTSDPESAVEGTIIAFAPDRAPKPVDPYAMGGPSAPNQRLPMGPGQSMLFETDDGVLALNAHRVWSVRFPDADVEQTFIRDVKRVELEANLASPSRGDWLSVSYLAKGITWAPSYLIDITDPKQARLSSKALIINEADDLDATHLDLITGFPNLQFADILSPVGKKEDLAGFLRSLGRGRSEVTGVGILSNVMTQSAEFRAGEAMGRPFAVPTYGAAAAGQIAEDLFLYPLDDITLAKGDTGYYPLFTETVPYTEFYHWEIPDYISEEDRYGQRQREERDKPEEVWHSLRLTNTTSIPWTTAPAQMLQHGNIIGQDTLKYTPPKGEATVKITQAISVKAEQAEAEVERERDAVRLYGYHYDRVTIDGTLSVTNYKDEKVSLEITKTLSGELKSTAPEAEDLTLARGLKHVNPVHLLTWKIDLAPGEHRDITYTYEPLIRR
ncbi:MAG: hypothetical protein KAX80_12040, partial [Planctomycetes bacterium]|nr:hypothetical protein [Planctomycetota bacterium]